MSFRLRTASTTRLRLKTRLRQPSRPWMPANEPIAAGRLLIALYFAGSNSAFASEQGGGSGRVDPRCTL
jgi:hypothetical protein